MNHAEICPDPARLQDPALGEAAIASKLFEPSGLVLVDDEFLFVSDTRNSRVRRVDLRDGRVVTVAGEDATDRVPGAGDPNDLGDGGPALDAVLRNPRGLAIVPREGFCADPERRLYIADRNNERIRVVEADGRIRTLENYLLPVIYLAVDPLERIFASNGADARRGIVAGVVQVDARGTVLWEIEDASLENPRQIVFNLDYTALYIADREANCIWRAEYDLDAGRVAGALVRVAGDGTRSTPPQTAPPLEFSINAPESLAFDPTRAGVFYCSSQFGSRLIQVDENGDEACTVLGAAGDGASGDGGDPAAAQILSAGVIQVDSAGTVYFTDQRNNRVRRFTPECR